MQAQAEACGRPLKPAMAAVAEGGFAGLFTGAEEHFAGFWRGEHFWRKAAALM